MDYIWIVKLSHSWSFQKEISKTFLAGISLRKRDENKKYCLWIIPII